MATKSTGDSPHVKPFINQNDISNPTGLNNSQLSLVISTLVVLSPAPVSVAMLLYVQVGVDDDCFVCVSWFLERGPTLQESIMVMREVTWLWWPVAPG